MRYCATNLATPVLYHSTNFLLFKKADYRRVAFDFNTLFNLLD